MKTTAHGLRTYDSSTSGTIIDISYIIEGDSAYVVSRSANFDDIKRMTRAGAREHYMRATRVQGFKPCEPTYRAVEVDAFGRSTAKRYAEPNEWTVQFKVGDAVALRGLGKRGTIVGYGVHDFTGRRTYAIRFAEGGIGDGYDDHTVSAG